MTNVIDIAKKADKHVFDDNELFTMNMVQL